MDSQEILDSNKKVVKKVRKIVAEQLCLNLNQVSLEANFATALGADSLDVVELVMCLEEGFGINIPDASAAEISTVKEAALFVIKQLERKNT